MNTDQPRERGGKTDAPGALNILILIAAIGCSCALLYGASTTESTAVLIACAIGFSFTANTLFSLLHESVHGSFHRHVATNEWGGRFAAAFFPTGLTLQRAFHLTHHRNNRGPAEQFDYLRHDDSALLKYAQWYAILTGIYWLGVVFGALMFALCPPAIVQRLKRGAESRAGVQTSANEYFNALETIDPWRARLEVLASFGLQFALYKALNGSLAGWAACYGLFALQWSGLQYADHAFSPLDSHDGAWDLTVNRVSRFFFLNYHYHLAHHRHPSSSWINLPSLVDDQRPRPGYGRMWMCMWLGPRVLPEDDS